MVTPIKHGFSIATVGIAVLLILLLGVSDSIAGVDGDADHKKTSLSASWQGPGWQVTIGQRGSILEVKSWVTSDPSKTGGRAQAEAAALKSARYLAYARLRQMLADLASSGKSASLRGVRIFSERVSWNPDGQAKGEVILRMPYSSRRGELAEGGVSSAKQIAARTIAPLQSAGGRLFRPRDGSHQVARPGRPYTGLIVVARGIGARPAMFPSIVEESTGCEVYGSEHVDPDAAFERGAGSFALSVAKARKLPRVGDNPLVVQAVRADGPHKARLVVSYPQAVRIYEADRRFPFLAKCGVVVVIDPLTIQR